jgi:hypothetical protein
MAYSKSVCAFSPLEGSFHGPKGTGEAPVDGCVYRSFKYTPAYGRVLVGCDFL